MAADSGQPGDGGVPLQVLRDVGQARQDVGDHGGRDLDAYGVFGGAHEAADPQVLLDPLEKQLDLPAFLIKTSVPYKDQRSL